ncbi:FG-GAP repeat domain-containing protein [Streptomyces sp. NPDC093225]|uniref:FG-GAP repeat domain-containing protein n=1 Tax=Streptomyces sp. NPDC093225 TaxID=3366034 RepID=UPI00382BE63D
MGLAVAAYDTSGNLSVTQILLRAEQPQFVYAPGRTPASGRALHDLHGDLDGDGYADVVATDAKGGLRLHPGKGTGRFGAARTIGTSGWKGALVAHGGDFTGIGGGGPDGYEDYVVRFAGGRKLYLYPNSGLGTPFGRTKQELVRPSAGGADQDWSRVRQLLLPGDLDGGSAYGYRGGNDLLVRECADATCTDAGLTLFRGRTRSDGSADQTRPFDLGSPVRLGATGWRSTTVLSMGDMNGDGVQDLVTRNESTGRLALRPGRITRGAYSLGSSTPYATAGFSAAERPRLASAGNVQGRVVTGSYTDPAGGPAVPYRQFRPTAGRSYGDFWATTPADPARTVRYVDADGTRRTTTCVTGCLLFHPGGRTAPSDPLLAGTAGWATTVTGIF